MSELNLKGVTELIKKVLTDNLEDSKYKLKIEEYSWCVTLYICDPNDCHLHEINIRRFDHEDNFGIGIPDYDRVRYFTKGNLSTLDNSVIYNFLELWNKDIDYQVKSLKEQVCEYEEIKIKELFKC